MEVAYVGWNCKNRMDAHTYIQEAVAPESYKSAEAIGRYKDKHREKAEYEAQFKAFTGEFSDMFVITYRENSGFLPVVQDWPKTPILHTLAKFNRVSVLDMSVFLRLARVDCIDKIGYLHPNLSWALPMHWQDSTIELLNPLYELTGVEANDMTDLPAAKQRFPQLVENLGHLKGAEHNAMVTAYLSRMIGK